MIFPENYYQLEEVFKIDGSGQQCIVTAPPVRKADNMWSVTVRLIDNDYREVLDVTACQPGMTTHWLGNAKPEMSDCGNFVLPQFKIFLIAGNSLKKISSESL